MKQSTGKGFTLVEVIIVVAVIGIIAFLVSTMMFSGIQGYFKTDFRKEALDQSRIAMERITREVRNVKSRSDIGTATATQLCFVTNDGIRVSFRYPGSSANTIAREEPAACPGSAGNTLAENISAFSFSYLQADGTVDPAPPASTKRIRISISSTISGETVTLQSDVWPRSL